MTTGAIPSVVEPFVTPGFIVLLGGARSGKSRLAVELAEASMVEVVLIATAEAGDADMAARIEQHRATRPAHWATIEEPIHLDSAVARAPQDSFVIIDCLTLWVANLLFADLTDEEILARADALAVQLARRAGSSVVVSNEVGLGIHPDHEIGRRYRDLLGGVNRVVTHRAWRTLFLVAGRAVVLDDPRRLLT